MQRPLRLLNMPKTDLRSRISGWRDYLQVMQMARQVAANARLDPERRPVVMMNISSRLGGFSQNAAFSLLAGWGLRLAGTPVKHFVCQAGLSHCVLGTNRQDFRSPPPCKACIRQSRRMFSGADVRWFKFQPDAGLAAALQDLNVEQLCQFEYPAGTEHRAGTGHREEQQVGTEHRAGIEQRASIEQRGGGESRVATSNLQPAIQTPPSKIPLGRLVLPSIRWALRRHTLPDDEATRYLLRQYILSAYNVACEFAALLEECQPSTAVIFNGIMYPEGAARWVAQHGWAGRQYNLRVVTHEVGFQRFSAFFTEGEATAYPIHIPESFELSPQQNARLDAYLEQRFQGQFSMAGIRFWPEMRGLDEAFLHKAACFRQIVPIFTNVVYDTSQVHANRVFPHMFAWLDLALEIIRAHPDTLFVIRAHPDEMRPGTAKQSRESVREWVSANGVDSLPNVVFIDSQEYISSYELIQRAKFVIVYNSSIGMEASLIGAAVLCGGKARYTQYPIVFSPDTPQAYRQAAEDFLACESIPIPTEFARNARRFQYYQLYRASLSFEDYLQDGGRKGYVRLRPFSWRALLPENSATLRVITQGISRDAVGESRQHQSENEKQEDTRQAFLLEDAL
ncbi:MAG: hypothetical protein JXA78_10465 [Anaerolineales bacterium]|nr:hypothetical protein [Anaerolineales bacterium]